MKTENQSNSNCFFYQIGLDLILKPNQLDEQIRKLKRLDQMIFPPKTEQIHVANTPNRWYGWKKIYIQEAMMIYPKLR